MEETLLAIDPAGDGGDTGIVFLRFSKTQPATVAYDYAIKGGYEGFKNEFVTVIAGLHPDYVVCETFVNRNIPGADLTPILIEGVVRFLFENVTLQPAAGKNSMVPDRILKQMGMWWPGDHHGDRNEAIRHGLIWLRNTKKHRPTLEAMYGYRPDAG